MLHRIVAMLTRMAMKFDSVGESSMEHDAEIDYDNEHRVAEHEHDEVDLKLRNRQNNAVHLSGRTDV